MTEPVEEQIELSKEELDTVIDWMNKMLSGTKDDNEIANEANQGGGLTLDEQMNMIKIQVHISFQRGSITLTDNK